MSTQVQYRRGTAAQHANFVGAPGEITVDTTNNTLRVHDGITTGGHPLTLQALFNAHLAETVSRVGAFTRDTSLAGTQKVALPKKAKSILLYATMSPSAAGKASWGFVDESLNNRCVFDAHSLSPNSFASNLSESIVIVNDATNRTFGKVTSIENDGFTVSWTHLGSGATGNVSVSYIASFHGGVEG